MSVTGLRRTDILLANAACQDVAYFWATRYIAEHVVRLILYE